VSAFQGFPAELFEFFAELERDNSKKFWTAHKSVWGQQVRDPMQALLDDLAPEFGHLRMLRPNRDVRFSTDKSPYKLVVAAMSDTRATLGTSYYVEVSATRLVTGCGAVHLARDQLERFRAAVDDERSGRELVELHTALTASSLPLTPGIEPPLKSGPRGYPADHPRAEYLRWKGAAVIQEYERAAWLHTPEPLERVRTVWRAAAPLKAWLDAHVGASQLPARQPDHQARVGQPVRRRGGRRVQQSDLRRAASPPRPVRCASARRSPSPRSGRRASSRRRAGATRRRRGAAGA
jgi:uncharacterized protein (TIGR02453 family)